jgi:hypothetical protein
MGYAGQVAELHLLEFSSAKLARKPSRVSAVSSHVFYHWSERALYLDQCDPSIRFPQLPSCSK